MARMLKLTGSLLLMLSPLPAMAEGTSYSTDGYAYYNLWWLEQRADEETALLLHFGQPQPHPWTRPGNKKVEAERRTEEPDEIDMLLDDLAGGGGDLGGGGGLDDVKDQFKREHQQEVRQSMGRDRSEKAPAGRVLDYSPNLGGEVLPEGVSKTDDGRFGGGLKLTGKTGLSIAIGREGGLQTMEGWFKPAALPDEPVCLLDSRGEGAKLMLHPDGKVSLTWRAFESDQTMRIETEKPIKAGQWSHLAAYVFKAKHIEEFANKGKFHEVRIAVNGGVAAVHRRNREFKQGDLLRRGPLAIGMNEDGGEVYTGLVEEVRVAGFRRYNPRVHMPWRDPDAERPIPFGPPHFEADARVFHASFEDRTMTVSQGKDRISWDLGKYADFEDMQVPGPYGKGLRVDPAFGAVRIPIKGMSPTEGTLEMWWKPANWDNHTDFSRIDWSKHLMSVARLMGRDRKTGKIVQFMEVKLARATVHGESTWIHPGQWNHFIWTWSPKDVHKEDGWGDTRAGDPIGTFRAWRFDQMFYRGMLKRDTRLIDRVEPLYMEIGITDDITVYHGQRPTIMIDEVIGYDRAYRDEEKKKAHKRWTGELSD